MLKYNLFSLFYELKIIISTFLIFYFFSYLNVFNSILKEYFQFIFTNKLKLNIQINKIYLNILNGSLEINEVVIYHPNKINDNRWTSDIMAYIEKITFKFDIILLIYAYIYNPNKLLVFNTINVHGIDLFVEGYEEEGKKTILNLKLIGGENKTVVRLRKPTYLQIKEQQREERRKKRQQLAQARAQAIRARSGSLTFHKNNQGNLLFLLSL